MHRALGQGAPRDTGQRAGRPLEALGQVDAQEGLPALRACRPVCPALWSTAPPQPPQNALAPPNKPPVGDSLERILCSSRQCRFAWNGFLLTFLMGLTVPVSCHRGFGFLAFAFWAFNAPFPGTLTSTSLPARLRALFLQTNRFPGCSSALSQSWGGRG